MTQLFSPTDGIGLSFLRQPIGASDFSLSHYSYDDVPFGEADESLSRFSTARDEAYVFPRVAGSTTPESAPLDPGEPVEPAGLDEDQRHAGRWGAAA